MSEIDSYKHKCIGVITCPSSYIIEPRISTSGKPLQLPLYLLEENTYDERGFDGKRGDLLLGGGSGESPAFRLSIPEAFYYYTHEDWDGVGFEYVNIDQIYKAFWSVTEAFKFGEGYCKIGWQPDEAGLEDWLAQHILAFLIKHYSENYQQYLGVELIEQDGSICRLPTIEEIKGWDNMMEYVKKGEYSK